MGTTKLRKRQAIGAAVVISVMATGIKTLVSFWPIVVTVLAGF